MMDIWLIFNLLLPFMEVLLHTYIDNLRNDEDRKINHHGTTIKPNQSDIDPTITLVQSADSKLDVISRNEETQVSALKQHYARMKERETEKTEKRLKFCLMFANVYNPIAAISFVSVYWILGLKEAEYF